MHTDHHPSNGTTLTDHDHHEQYLPAMPTERLVELCRRVLGAPDRDE